MTSAETVRLDYDLEPYGPLTRTESMIEAMDAQAQEVSRRYDRHDVSLLAEALGSVGMNIMDLSNDELSELADVEGTIEIKYGINEQDDDGTEEEKYE